MAIQTLMASVSFDRMIGASSWLVFLVLTMVLASAPIATPSTERSAAQLYRQCVSCHGSDGRAKTNKGKYSHARDLTDATWQDDVTDERIFNSIMNGRNVRGNMPAFGKKFSEAEINSLVKYVRGLRK